MRYILVASLVGALVVGSGCKPNKALQEEVASLKADLAKMEEQVDRLIGVIFPHEAVQKKPYEVSIGDSPVWGDKDAPTEIIVWSNFGCSYCKLADTSLRKLMKDDRFKGKIKIAFKHFPFARMKMAGPAAMAAEAARLMGGDPKFWEMAEKLFQNQQDLSPENFVKWAQEIGLDGDKFSQVLKDNKDKFQAKIDSDTKEGSEKAKLQGTPWIVVGGYVLKKAVNAENLLEIMKKYPAKNHKQG